MPTSVFEIFPLIVGFVAAVAYLNHRFMHQSTTTAIMGGSLVLSIFVLLLGKFGYSEVESKVFFYVSSLDFHKILMQGMLSFMLFAGALNINIYHLWRCKWEIATLASLSTICSNLLIAVCLYYCLPCFGLSISFIYCLLFGALISPTDPIAVLALFKSVNANKKLNVTIAGESLFNDGVGIVLFLTFYDLAFGGNDPTVRSVLTLFFREFFGGILFGGVMGFIGLRLLQSIKPLKIEILITLAIVTTGYAVANSLKLSGPLAMVTAGIIIGSESGAKRKNLYDFWEVIDELLNAFLFFLIGIELVAVSHNPWSIGLGLFSVLMVLMARTITVSIPLTIFKRYKKYPERFIRILIWGGLRGGLAVALALSLPPGNEKNLLLTMTYSVVVFSILVQGVSIPRLLVKK